MTGPEHYEVLKTERMGHEMPGMHGVYGYVSPAMPPISKPLCKSVGTTPCGSEVGSVRARSCPRWTRF